MLCYYATKLRYTIVYYTMLYYSTLYYTVYTISYWYGIVYRVVLYGKLSQYTSLQYVYIAYIGLVYTVQSYYTTCILYLHYSTTIPHGPSALYQINLYLYLYYFVISHDFPSQVINPCYYSTGGDSARRLITVGLWTGTIIGQHVFHIQFNFRVPLHVIYMYDREQIRITIVLDSWANEIFQF